MSRMHASLQVKQYVAKVRSDATGASFFVFRTGDDRFYLFALLDPSGEMTTISFPVLKSRLRNDLRRALANGWGNAI